MGPGRLIAVVGPSGVGKDSVIDALVARVPGLCRVRRVVTRPEGAGGEDVERVTPAEFAARRAAGGFALCWQAHGLSYGIPSSLHDTLAAGDAVANLSRAVLADAQAAFPGLAVLSLSAERQVLARRLAGRGREDGAGIAARLARRAALPPGLAVTEIDNSGTLDGAVAAALAALYPDSATR